MATMMCASKSENAKIAVMTRRGNKCIVLRGKESI
jgi:hypothetical protein